MLGSAFYSYVDSVYMTPSFREEGIFGLIKLIKPHHFLLKCLYQVRKKRNQNVREGFKWNEKQKISIHTVPKSKIGERR
jgi:hypothetical protein